MGLHDVGTGPLRPETPLLASPERGVAARAEVV